MVLVCIVTIKLHIENVIKIEMVDLLVNVFCFFSNLLLKSLSIFFLFVAVDILHCAAFILVDWFIFFFGKLCFGSDRALILYDFSVQNFFSNSLIV